MKIKKKALCLCMTVFMVLSMVPAYALATVHNTDLQSPELIRYFRSVDTDSPMRNYEYYDITTNGLTMTVSGKTVEHYAQYIVAIRTPNESKYLLKPDCYGIENEDNTFSKTLDFSSLADGNYLVSVRFNHTGDNTFQKEAQMRYVPVRKISTGVFVERYTAIEQENERIMRSNTYPTQYYLDTSMSDMRHELRNGREYSKEEPTSLTNAQQITILSLAKRIVGSETNPYKQMLLVHDYLCENIYYDVPYNLAETSAKRQMAKDGEIILNPYDLAICLLQNKETKTVCNGFASLYAAIMRSLNIPCRSVRGKALRIPGSAWHEQTDEQLASTTHVWNEVYVNGRWVFVDATKDCSNDYTADGEYVKNADEIKRYSGFDASKQAIAVNVMYSSYRESVHANLNIPVVTKISNRYAPIDVSWSAVEGAKSYKLYRSKGEGHYDLIANLTQTSYVDENVEAGTAYYYKVTAVDENEVETRKSSYRKVTVTAIPQTQILFTDSKEGEITITFQGIPEVNDYYVYRSDSRKGTYKFVGEVESSEEQVSYIDDEELIYGKTYYYKVRGVRGKDVKAPLSAPMAREASMVTPELLSISSKNKQVILEWELIDQAVAYYILRSDEEDGDYEVVGEVDGETDTYESGILTADETYFYRIMAESEYGAVSEMSDCLEIDVEDTPVPKLRSVSNNNRKIRLRWYPLGDVVRYYVYRSTDNEHYKLVQKVSPNTLLYESGYLTANKKYYWKIRAVMSNGAITDYSEHKAITAKARK